MAFDIITALQKSTGLKEEQIQFVLNTPASSYQGTISEALARREYSTADDLVSEFCQQMGLEFIKDIPINDISVDLIANIPINYAKSQLCIPFRADNDQVIVLTSNPLNNKAFDDLRIIFKKKIKPLITTVSRIVDAINKVYEKSTANLAGLDDVEADDTVDLENQVIDLLDAGEDDAPVIKLVNSLLFRAVKEKASDIHIECFEKDMLVRFRVDGVLIDIFKPPKKLQNSITSRVKVMSSLNIAEKRLPQDGRIPLKIGGKDIDVRVNIMPTAFGERVVMRLADRSNTVLELEQLGFSEPSLLKFDDILARTYGILLVTGPTGSGKSTTLYAAISKINSSDINIVTVEDPVEQRIHGIGQVPVNTKIGLTFASGLRAILRQDPDVIMIGEIRDLETAEIAINSSLTGHLVLSTLHTNDSAGAFPRLIDMGCEPFLIATSLQGIIAQRLVRILCPHCKTVYRPTEIELQNLGVTRDAAERATICKKVGCNQCNGKGYVGRTIIEEFMMVTENIRTLIMQRKDGATIRKQAIQDGMQTFREHGVQKVLAGLTTIEELFSNTQMDI
jgi:general secretion pathway protein E